MKKVVATLMILVPMFASAQINLNNPPARNQATTPAMAKEPVKPASANPQSKAAEHRNRMFSGQDANGDGYINKQELDVFMKRQHAKIKSGQVKGSPALPAPTSDDVAKVFDGQDTNKDGRISKEEYEQFMKNVFGM